MGKLESLNTLIDIVDAGSFSAAARKLGLSNAGISKQISRLEEELGLLLLKRSAKHITPTEAGIVVLQHAKRMRSAELDIQAASELFSQEPSGVLNVHSTIDFANLFILPHLGEFIKENPQITIRLDARDRVPNLKEENIDISFGLFAEFNAMSAPSLVRRMIFKSKMGLYASQAYIKKHGQPKTPEDLNKHFLIIHSGERDGAKNVLMMKNGLMPITASLYVNSTDALYQLMINNLGIGQLPEFRVKHELNDGRLVPVLDHFQQAAQPLYYHYSSNRLLLPKIKAFAKFVMQYANDER